MRHGAGARSDAQAAHSQACNFVIFFIGPVAIAMSTFSFYSLLGEGELTLARVLAVLAYLNLIRLPMALFPRCLGGFVESLVSFGRLEDFFPH